jgi:hypothetical protein
MNRFTPLYTLAHVMAEVSNLTDLWGRELLQARQVLKETLARLQEPAMASVQSKKARPACASERPCSAHRNQE